MSNPKTAADGSQEEQQEEFVIVETDESGKPIKGDEQDGKDDAKGIKDEDEDEDEDEEESDDDERVGQAEGEQDDNTTETEEERIARRKRENRAKKVRQRAQAAARERLIDSMSRQIAAQNDRLAAVEGRTVEYNKAQITNQIREVESQQRDAKTTYAALAKKGDWEGVAEVGEIQLTLREQHRQLMIALERSKKGPADGGVRTDGSKPDTTRTAAPKQAEGLAPEIQERAEQWKTDHKWFHPKNRDQDTRTVRALEREVLEDGLHPNSTAFWDELDSRIRKALPHKYSRGKSAPKNGERRVSDNQEPGNGKATNTGGPRMAQSAQNSSSRSLGKNEVRISPARKQAMVEAGAWDDPAKRSRMLKAYKQYDEQHTEG